MNLMGAELQNLHESHSEHQIDGKLSFSTKVEIPQHLRWCCQNSHLGQDIEKAAGDQDGREVDARSGDRRVPDLLARKALTDLDDGGREIEAPVDDEKGADQDIK